MVVLHRKGQVSLETWLATGSLLSKHFIHVRSSFHLLLPLLFLWCVCYPLSYKSFTEASFHQLLEFLSDSDEATAEDVLVFVREAVQRYPQLKTSVANKLLEVFSHIKSIK